MSSKDKFKITIKEENSLESLNIVDPQNILDDIYLIIEENDLTIYNFKTNQKLQTLKYHSNTISKIHLCKKPISIDNILLIPSNNIFFVLSSSLDKKFAMHKIVYKDNIFQFELIAEYKPTKDEINGVIQIENGQFIVSTRDQHIILFSQYINNKNFNKLYEIEKPWPMEALSPFEIKNNIIGVYWIFDDFENDEIYSDNDKVDKDHSNDGLYIYEIKNNKIYEIKILKIDPEDYHSFIYLKNVLIMKCYKKYEKLILTLDKINFQIINNLTYTDDFSQSFDISSFDNNFFILVIYEVDKPIIFKIYDNKTLKKVYESESEKKYFKDKNNVWFYSLYKLKNNEYLLKNLIIKIEKNK